MDTKIFTDTIASLFTKENITLFLSIFGSIGTLGTWIYHWIKSRKNFDLEINGYLSTSKGLLLHMQLINKSSLPLSIKEIAISLNGTEYICNKIPQKVLTTSTKTNNIVKSQHEYFSMTFPINLDPLCGSSGYLYFSSDQETFPLFSNEVILIIRTNRGHEVQKTLLLKNPLH